MFILVGPKGVGKSTIGRAVAARNHVCFVDAEAIARKVFAQCGGKVDDRYARRAHEAILIAVQEAAERHPVVLFETTGASEHAASMLSELRGQHALHLVRLRASELVCAARIAQRDQAAHVPVDPQIIHAMFEKVQSLDWPWDLTIDNDAHGGVEPLVAALASFVGSVSSSA